MGEISHPIRPIVYVLFVVVAVPLLLLMYVLEAGVVGAQEHIRDFEVVIRRWATGESDDRC